VLKELLEHHIEEEEDDMFKKAKSLLSKEELVDLGSKMQARKESVLAAAKKAA
jgi:hemerythrin-like domain-containing protein